MLCNQLASDLADFATLGGASNRATFEALTSLATYQKIIAIYDADSAGDQARQNFNSFPRIKSFIPPAHDLTDYHHLTGELRSYLSSLLHT